MKALEGPEGRMKLKRVGAAKGEGSSPPLFLQGSSNPSGAALSYASCQWETLGLPGKTLYQERKEKKSEGCWLTAGKLCPNCWCEG